MQLANRGFSLLEVVVAIGISSIVVFGTSQVIQSSVKTEKMSEKQFWIAERRLELQSFLNSDSGWNQIISLNPNMNCFDAGTSCSAFTSPQALKLILDEKTLDGSNPGLGMTGAGDFCTTYTPIQQSSCNVKVQMQWQAICDNSACLHAQPKITIRFESQNLNTGSLDLIIYRDPKMNTLLEVCQSMGGTLSGTTCALPNSTCNPAAGSFVLGFDGSGTAICGRPNPGSCASSDSSVGFNASGNILCAPSCP